MCPFDLADQEIEEIRKEIQDNYAQEPSFDDRMLDLDKSNSIFGDNIEKRNEFARDRDRIIYSTAFRRLEHKAQVYSHEKGDHYRTRLTHTLEVMQISRGIARNLGLNEDLTEAIALGHDIGHTPFGHAGEEVLDGIMRGEDDLGGKLKYKIDYKGFKHNFHSLKVLDVIERKYEKEKGLNLTWQVLEGILKHTKTHKKGKTWDLSRFVKNEDFFEPFKYKNDYHKNTIKEISSKTNGVTPQSHEILESSLLNVNLIKETIDYSLTLEGQVVYIADEIAQRQHDLDDGLRDVELRMNVLNLLKQTEEIINTTLKEIILERIVAEISFNKSFIPINLLLDGLNDTINELRIGLLNEDNDFTKKLIKDILFPIVPVDIFFANYDKYLDQDIKLLFKLKKLIHESKAEKYDFKWKNRMRNVISYFIHDVSINTMKNVKERSFNFYKNNPYERKANADYLDKKGVKKPSDLKKDNKQFYNQRDYAKDKFVSFSETAEKFNKKIEQFIDNRIINSFNVNRFDGKAKFIIRQLFKAYYENPKQMSKTQLNYLSNLINENMDKYCCELQFKDKTYVRDIKFDSEPEFVLDLKKLDKLVDLLKLEVKLEDLKNPSINFSNDPCINLEFLEEIEGNRDEIDKKGNYLDDESLNILIYSKILEKINEMDKSEIENKEKETHEKVLFIKCLIENHYAFLSVICDHIAGMTDNYAKNEYKKLYLV
jgi:dGTPase